MMWNCNLLAMADFDLSILPHSFLGSDISIQTKVTKMCVCMTKLILSYNNCYHGHTSNVLLWSDNHCLWPPRRLPLHLLALSQIMTMCEQKMIKISWLCASRTHAHDIIHEIRDDSNFRCDLVLEKEGLVVIKIIRMSTLMES